MPLPNRRRSLAMSVTGTGHRWAESAGADLRGRQHQRWIQNQAPWACSARARQRIKKADKPVTVDDATLLIYGHEVFGHQWRTQMTLSLTLRFSSRVTQTR